MKKIHQTLADYDDYVDLCDTLGVEPQDMFADNFYNHWNEIKQKQHVVQLNDSDS
jgi:hypothetical protein